MKTSDYLRVLYADDNADDCLMINIMLEFSGIKVTAANTVAEAWRLAQAEQFDLYLLDSRFPDGDGLDLCRRLREHAPRAPIIFYTGNAYKTDVQKGLAAGADAYLVKPNSDKIVPAIFQLIGRGETVKIKKTSRTSTAVWHTAFQNSHSESGI